MSLSPFDADELSRILKLIGHLRENAEENDFHHSICIIARFMHYFSKFLHFCGLPCARLDVDISAYEEDPGFNLLTTTFLYSMLFWAPQRYSKSGWTNESTRCGGKTSTEISGIDWDRDLRAYQ
ncbi:hypothetical protein DFH29DRAFT_912406 [Suillus ampliporus]|nr:hypothetical protein DFH29DRAFT_912406 [Suillus ampliporus]